MVMEVPWRKVSVFCGAIFFVDFSLWRFFLRGAKLGFFAPFVYAEFSLSKANP